MKIIKFFFLITSGFFILACSNQATNFSLPSQNTGFSGDTFYNNKVDILFVVDNSKSMIQYQQRLAANINSMISVLDSLKMDYHVAVTTTTMSTNSSAYPMTRQLIGSPTYLSASNINLLTDRLIVGEAGSDLERGLDAMAYVTSSSYLNAIHSDFIRSDALFTVIFISDEQDMSSEFGDGNSNNFIDLLNSRKPQFSSGSRAWIANYIGILTNQSCGALGGYVAIGTQYIKLVDESNGSKSSICMADLSSAVSNIKSRIVAQITSYRFTNIPNKSTIQVTIAGRSIFEDSVNGWTLETEKGGTGQTIYILKFHGSAIPAADQYVDVKYTAAGAG